MAKINIVQKTTLVENRRIDSDFFQKKYIELDRIIEGAESIQKTSDTVDLQSNGAFRVIFNILNDNHPKAVPYIRSGNVGDFFINKDELHSISKKAHSQLRKTHTRLGDILMARKGKIGGATLITQDDIGYNSNDNVTNIRLKNNDYLPAYFVAFWNCKYGLQQVERFATGNVQPWLSMKQIRMLRTVNLDNSYQKEISDIVIEAYSKDKKSKSLYQQANELLEQELGLNTIMFTKPRSYTASLSEVVNNARISSYFFEPRFKQLNNLLCKFDTSPLRLLINNYSTGFAFAKKHLAKEKSIAPLIKIANIKPMNIDLTSTDWVNELGKEVGSKETIKKGDILIGMSGSVGTSAVIRENIEAYINQRILRINGMGKIDPEYLALVINSIIGKMQFEQYGTGGVQVNISPRDMLNIKIPRLGEIETEISKLIKESIHAKKKSQQLLEQAKARVEQLIEEAANKN